MWSTPRWCKLWGPGRQTRPLIHDTREIRRVKIGTAATAEELTATLGRFASGPPLYVNDTVTGAVTTASTFRGGTWAFAN